MPRALLGSLLIHAIALALSFLLLGRGAGRGAAATPRMRVTVHHAADAPEPRWVPPEVPRPQAAPPEPPAPDDVFEEAPPEVPPAPDAPEPPADLALPRLGHRLPAPLRRAEPPPAAPPQPPVAPPPAPAPGRLTPPRRLPDAAGRAYPPRARAMGIEGRVVLRLDVSARGEVLDARVARSSGHRILDDAAVREALRLRFEPARRDGVAVPCRVPWAVEFRLTD